MEQWTEIMKIEEEPFGDDFIEDVYVPSYASCIEMPNVYAYLVFRYFEKFDKKYGTSITFYVDFKQHVGYRECKDEESDEGYVWYEEAPIMMVQAMDNTGWIQLTLDTEQIMSFMAGREEIYENKELFLKAFEKYLSDVYSDVFVKNMIQKHADEVYDLCVGMEEGILLLIWNPDLSSYKQFRKDYPNIIKEVVKEEDERIMKLVEDVWEPYEAFFDCQRREYEEIEYCSVILGSDGYSFISYDAINPNWICKAVKLDKMLRFAWEKIKMYQIRSKARAA